MNLDIMLKAQRELDERIIKKHGLEGQDLFPNTIVALQVELAEMANEARWFKFWSEDRGPRNHVRCEVCGGYGQHYQPIDGYWEMCPMCEGDGLGSDENPLLEEYVDCVHFFLSAAIQKGWESRLLESNLSYEKINKNRPLTELYLDISHSLLLTDESWGDAHFEDAWLAFTVMGSHYFGFSEDEIENAYFRKNRINNERQATGY